MNEAERAPEVVLAEAAPMLAIMATRGLYDEQPALWKLGEHGRARTVEDFNHHFRALEVLDAAAFRGHVQYCEQLFSARGYPMHWLTDAWRWMAVVIERELPSTAAEPALSVLHQVTGAGGTAGSGEG